MSSDQPSGVVTLLFTDIEGSTKLLHTLPVDVALETFALHGRVLRQAFAQYGGYEQRTEGDSFFIVFPDATAAVAAAVEAQRLLATQDWPGSRPLRVRMGLHTGEPTPVEGDYVGLDVHRAARIAAAGHGGQVLVSEATRAGAALPQGVMLRDLGDHRLKDLAQPERIYQLQIEGLDSDFPPLNSLETPSNLPVSGTRLVGRDAEVTAVEDLLRREDVRMVTITGVGGSGKTRLAVAAAERLGDAFRNGLVFVDLTTVSDPARVAETIAIALELPSVPGVPAVDSVVTQLRDRAVLFVLDGFERVAEAAGDVADLLAGARRVKVIVTSRAALRVAAEREYSLQLLSPAAASELFFERARAARPGLHLTDTGTVEVVQEICARLDLLPLAIELAAARVKLLSLEQILAHLDTRLGLLRGGRRDAPARQQTLRAAIAWSYDLLPSAAAALLRSAAVLVGGIAVDALERISEDPLTLEGLEVLVDQSLLRNDPDSGRFFLLETIREFALEQGRVLGELSETRQKHAAFFTELATRAEEGLHGPERTVWRERVDDEQPNLLAALEWALTQEPPQTESAATLAIILGTYWYTHGRAVEGAAWLRRVHALDGIPVGLRAQLAQRLGVLLDQQTDKEGAAVVLEEAIELFRRVEDRSGEARALNSLGSASRRGDSTKRPRELFERSLRIRQELGDEEGISIATFNLAQLAMDDGDFDTARRLFERSNQIDMSLGEDWGAAIGSLGIAAAAVEQRDFDEAAPRLRAAVQFFLDAEDEDHLAEAIVVCAFEACARGCSERSARLLGAADGLWDRIGVPIAPADAVRVEQCRSVVRAALGERAFEQAAEEGRVMTADQAVAFALEPAETRVAESS